MSGSGYEFGNLADVENFKQIIKCYLRYILISGCCHCRGKNELAYIGCYTLGCLHKVICNDSDIKIGVAVDAPEDLEGFAGGEIWYPPGVVVVLEQEHHVKFVGVGG
jgi:hypothetical protein